MFIVKIKKLTEDCIIPQKAHIDEAAFDIYAAENIIVEPQKPTPVSTGFCMELPPQTEAQIRPRSGLALKHSITVLNTPGTVDAGYGAIDLPAVWKTLCEDLPELKTACMQMLQSENL